MKRSLYSVGGFVLIAVLWASIAASDRAARSAEGAGETVTPSAATTAAASAINPDPEQLDEEPVDLGEPLVENFAELKPLDPKRPLWIDPKQKRVVMMGQVCQRAVPLEVFACLRYTKEHEAIVSVPVKAFAVHSALLAIGAKPGHPAQFAPQFRPAAGEEIEITLIWKDENGQQKTARAQDWIRDVNTKKAMAEPWVFAGSAFWDDEYTGQRRYLAEGGDFICISNFPGALLDVPVRSSDVNTDLSYETFTDHIPPRGTVVTMILAPKPKAAAKDKPGEKAPDKSGANATGTGETGAGGAAAQPAAAGAAAAETPAASAAK